MNTHTMIDTGNNIWKCNSCARIIQLSFPPEYSYSVIIPGDEYITHIGGIHIEVNKEPYVDAQLEQDIKRFIHEN